MHEPRISICPQPQPATSLKITVDWGPAGFPTPPGAELRFTTDGSRPNAQSPRLPPDGILLHWPGPSVAFNVKGFLPGLRPSITNGAVLELGHRYPLP